jgi:hypothetical protein
MASQDFPYPSDLDSDGDGGYDSDDFQDSSDDDDDDSLADNMSFMSLASTFTGRRPNSKSPGSWGRRNFILNTRPDMCIVCDQRPPYVDPRTGQSPYPTCGLTCATALEGGYDGGYSNRGSRYVDGRLSPRLPCVVCKTRSAYRSGYVTCGLKCAEKLSKDGGDPTMCDYCHRKPRTDGSSQCGSPCIERAKVACLLCKSRPKNGVGYQLCGKTCKRIATKTTPLILEAPKGHKTYDMVEKRLQTAWHNVTVKLPTIKRIFKIIEDDEFLRPYADYKKLKGNERFRYHGTGRQCQLGVSTTDLCSSATCPVCSILKTSFKISLANTSGAFGAGVYTSSAPNKAYNYTGGNGNGALLLTKVVLGNIKTVQAFAEVTSCPPGFDSVSEILLQPPTWC